MEKYLQQVFLKKISIHCFDDAFDLEFAEVGINQLIWIGRLTFTSKV